MASIRVSLFGKFQICGDVEGSSGFDARKVRELFCYLLLHRDRPHARDVLADLFWSDSSSVQTKKYLRQTLWQLQSSLAAIHPKLGEGDSDSSLLAVDAEWVTLNSHAGLWLDVALFEQAYLAGRNVPVAEMPRQTAEALQAAVGLYRGDLLEDCFQDWCIFERERLHNIYFTMLERLMAYCQVHGQYELGLGYGKRILRQDPARERTHRRMMRLYYLAGDRVEALRQYERCSQALAQELQVKPSRSTSALHDRIRADSLALTSTLGQEPVPEGDSSQPVLAAILEHLRGLQGTLAELQQQIHRDIEAVERITGWHN